MCRCSRSGNDAHGRKTVLYSVGKAHTIHGNFVYFVEDQVRFEIDLEYDWQSSIAYPGFAFPGLLQGFEHSSESGFVLSFGFNYNII